MASRNISGLWALRSVRRLSSSSGRRQRPAAILLFQKRDKPCVRQTGGGFCGAGFRRQFFLRSWRGCQRLLYQSDHLLIPSHSLPVTRSTGSTVIFDDLALRADHAIHQKRAGIFPSLAIDAITGAICKGVTGFFLPERRRGNFCQPAFGGKGDMDSATGISNGIA